MLWREQNRYATRFKSERKDPSSGNFFLLALVKRNRYATRYKSERKDPSNGNYFLLSLVKTKSVCDTLQV